MSTKELIGLEKLSRIVVCLFVCLFSFSDTVFNQGLLTILLYSTPGTRFFYVQNYNGLQFLFFKEKIHPEQLVY